MSPAIPQLTANPTTTPTGTHHQLVSSNDPSPDGRPALVLVFPLRRSIV
ncbi:hypothetical protein [Streptomyces sp. NBC_00328]|nr:hypothetical protein [Streptomyces sp. NBC_00328]